MSVSRRLYHNAALGATAGQQLRQKSGKLPLTHCIDHGNWSKIFTSGREHNLANEKLGVKRTCPKCGTRFYDLNREPITCISCGVSFEPEVILKPRRPVAVEEEKKPEKPKAKPAKPKDDEDDLDDDLLDGDDDDEDDDDLDDVLDIDEDDDEDDLSSDIDIDVEKGDTDDK